MKPEKRHTLWLVLFCGLIVAVSPILSTADGRVLKHVWQFDKHDSNARQPRDDRNSNPSYGQHQAPRDARPDHPWPGTKNRKRREDTLWNRKYSDHERRPAIKQTKESHHDRRRDRDDRHDGWRTERGRESARRYPDHERRHNTGDRHGNGNAHRHDKTPRGEVIVHRSHPHSPRYNLYQRKKYVYYRTPWYNTRYIAPIRYNFYPVGYRIHLLPESYIRISVGGYPYFYYSGVYYRHSGGTYIVVGAPLGAVVHNLPLGFIAFSLGLSTYYYVNDTYYIWSDSDQGYRVVEKPQGAEQAMEEATEGRLFAYPNKGQNEEQQASDRYECHRWAVESTDFDPTLNDQEYSSEENSRYKRAMAACLEGRDYTVR